MTNEQPPATPVVHDEYPSWVTPPMERPTRNRNIEPNNSGGYQEIGLDPGAFGAAWRGSVAQQIGDSAAMDILGLTFNPLQTLEAKEAPSRIFDGLLHSEITAEGSNPVDYLTNLQDIEKNPNRSGQDWFDALPQGMKKQFEDLDLIPVNAKNLDAYTVARDMKQSLAWMINNRDSSVGSSKRSWLTNTASGLALGAITDPTNIASFGIGHVAGKAAAKVVAKAAAAGAAKSEAATLLSKKLVANLGAQALVQQTTVAQNAMARNETSRRLGITPGQATQSEINKEGLLAAAQGAALGFTFHAAGYYGAAGVSKTKKAITDTVFKDYIKKLETGGIAMSDQSIAEMASRVYDDKPMNLPGHLLLLTEVTNAAYGTKLTPDVWDIDAMNAVGLHPSDLTRQVFEGGFSGKQMQQKMSIVDMVLEDAKNNHTPEPITPISEVTITGYRGVSKTRTTADLGVGEARFFSPSEDVAKSYAGTDGSVSQESLTFKNPFKASNWIEAKKLLNLPQDTSMGDLLKSARTAGHDGVIFENHNGLPEYVDLRSTATPASPVVSLKPLMKMGVLPKDVVDAGFMWGPLGDIVPDPNFVKPTVAAGAPTSPVDPVAPVTPPVPVKQPLLADHVPDITPRKATATAVAASTATPAAENIITRMFRESTSLKDFEKRMEVVRAKMESQHGPKVLEAFNKKWSQAEAALKTGYDEGKANLAATVADAKNDHQTAVVTKEQLVERAKALGAGDTVVRLNNRETDAAKGIEIPNLKDRLIWLGGKGMEETAKVRALLLEFYGMTESDVRAARDKMKAVIPKAPGKNLDRIRLTQDAQGNYSAEILRIGVDPSAAPKKVKPSKNLPAEPDGIPSKVKHYIKNRNDAVQRRLDAEANKPVKVVVAKTPETPSTTKSTFSAKEGLHQSIQAEYEALIKNGSLKQAYELLDRHLVGEGHYDAILQLSAETEVAKNSLDYSLRIGNEEEINKAKDRLTKVNDELAKRKEQLFAWSPASLKALNLKKPLKAANGKLTNFVLGTHYAPDAAHYTEPLAGKDDHKPTAEVIQILDSAFANVPLTADASRVSTNTPTGVFSSLANSLLSLNGAIFGRSDAAKVLLSDRPMLAQLINFIAPFRLTSEGELGTNKMAPFLESGFSRIKSSTNALIVRSTDELRAIGVHRFTPEYGQAVFDAARERIMGNGPLPDTHNRAATDIVLKYLGKYFDDSGKEALSIGKIAKFDPKYWRLILTRKASFQVEKVAGIFHEIMADHFALDESKIHQKTLDSLVSTVVTKADGNPIKTFMDLQNANPTLAESYLKALRSTDRNSPLYDMASKSIRTRMGLDVADATSISTDADFYMNSGLGQTIDQKLLVDPRMREFIETDIGAITSEYDKNIRYYIHRQKATDQFLSNITGRKITGITIGDALKYFKMKDIETSPGHTKEIDALYSALEQREGMINGRKRADASKDLLLDSLAIAASTPAQSSVAAGVSTVSQIAENLRSLIVSIPAAWSARSSGRSLAGNLYELFIGMSRKELYASAELMNTAAVRGSNIEFDGAHDNYVGGSFMGQKISNLVRLITEIKKSATEPVNSKSARTHAVTQAVSNALVEGPRQILMNEDMVAKAIQRHWWIAQYSAAEHLSNLIKNPYYYLKTLSRDEMVSHMEAAGLFSKESLKGIAALNQKYPRFLEGRFKWERLNDALLKLQEDPNVSNVDVRHASQFLQAYWNMLDRYSDTKVMSSPRLWDRANPNLNKAYLRLFNTFTGYTRWYFSRNAFQNFPNSSMGKVGGLIAASLLTEMGIKMIMDIAKDPKGAADKLGDPDEMENYIWKGAANVPLLGELSSNAGIAVSMIHDNLLPESKPLGMGNPRGHSMFEFKSWLPGITEVKKMINGEDYEFEKVRKLIPIMNSPIIGGFLKAADIQETKHR